MFSKAIWRANWKRFWIVPFIVTAILFLGITFQIILKTQEIEKREKSNPYLNDILDSQIIYQDSTPTMGITSIENGIEAVNKIELNQPIDVTEKVDTIQINMSQERYLRNILYGFLNVAIIFLLPVVLSILLFGYMNEEKSSSFIHGLPITKKKLYITNILTGITMYVLPYVINMIILLICNLGNMGSYLQSREIGTWFAINMLYHTVFFSFSVTVGMLCASKISHGILTYIVMYAPIGLMLCFTRLVEEMIYGFNAFTTQIEEIALKIPFIKIMGDFNKITYYYSNTQINLEAKTVIAYSIVAIILLVIAYFLYKKRKLEITKEFISFKAVQIFIKYATTLCINLLSYLYFYSIFDKSRIISIIASLIVTLIAYFITEMILKKTYKVLKSIKGYFVYTTIILVLYIIAINGALGFETRVPQIENIKEVRVRNHEEEITFDEKENIEAIIHLHKKIVEERKEGYYSCTIEYTLNNGKKLNRKYSYHAKEYEQELNNLFNTNEYIEEVSKTLKDSNYIKEIQIGITYRTKGNSYHNYKEIKIEKEDRKDFINLLLQDMQERKANIRRDYRDRKSVV